MKNSILNTQHEKVRLEYLDKGFRFSYSPQGYYATKGSEVHSLDRNMNLLSVIN